MPIETTPPVVEGVCNPVEYATAGWLQIDHVFGGAVRIQHSDDDLYVCISNLPIGQHPDSFCALMFDTDLSRVDPAQPSPALRFRINRDAEVLAEEGNGVGNFQVVTTPKGSWDARVSGNDLTWNAEFRISRTFLGIGPEWGTPIGFATGHFWYEFQGYDYLWPCLLYTSPSPRD